MSLKPTNNSKQRKATSSAKNQMQVITRRKGPFSNFKDNKQYFMILDTLERVYWYQNNNNNNNVDTPKCSSLSTVLVPGVILKLIAEYSSGKIHNCKRHKKTEILVMNDGSIYPRDHDHQCLATICSVNECHNVIFRCEEYIYPLPPNRCSECGDYLCDNCMKECSEDHPCCDRCLISCAGDFCITIGAPSICISHYLNYTQDITDIIEFEDEEYDNCGINQCGGCYEYYCYECALFGECNQCKKGFCSQCRPDWFCTNQECGDYACMNCNKDEMFRCKLCKQNYCDFCSECQELDDVDEFLCDQCEATMNELEE